MSKVSLKIQNIALAGIVALAFMFLLTPGARADGIATADVVKLLNQARADNGLKILLENIKLDQAAQFKADDMLKNDYFAHTSPSGVSPWYWFGKADYDYKFAGENLAVNFDNAESQQQAWMKSPTHRKNILNSNYQEVGVAVVKSKTKNESSILTVELFGTPLRVAASATPEKTQTLPQTQRVAGQETSAAKFLVKVVTPPVLQNMDPKVLNSAGLSALIVLCLCIVVGPAAILSTSWRILLEEGKHRWSRMHENPAIKA
jgi:hypothetical protein